tara:strand:+ start:258 stop:617 length:360 start_codon:yes stop_codon:yes gene_type:complete
MARSFKERVTDYLFLTEIYHVNLGLQHEEGKMQFEILRRRCCKNFFLATNAATASYYRLALKYVKDVGLYPRFHGNTGKRNRALTEDDKSRVTLFLNKYGQEFGLPDPIRVIGNQVIQN